MRNLRGCGQPHRNHIYRDPDLIGGVRVGIILIHVGLLLEQVGHLVLIAQPESLCSIRLLVNVNIQTLLKPFTGARVISGRKQSISVC